MRKTLKKRSSNSDIDFSINKCACCKKELRLVSIEISGNNYCSRDCLKTIGVVSCNTCENYNKKENMIYIEEKDFYCCKGKCANLNDFIACSSCSEYKVESSMIIKEGQFYCMGCKIKTESLNCSNEINEYDEDENLNKSKSDVNVKNIVKQSYGDEMKLINYITKEDKKYIDFLRSSDKNRLERLLERYSLMKERGFMNLGFEPLYLYDKRVKNVFKLYKEDGVYLLSISVLFFINTNGKLKEIHNLNKLDSLHILRNFVDNNKMTEFGLYIDIHDFRKNIGKRGE